MQGYVVLTWGWKIFPGSDTAQHFMRMKRADQWSTGADLIPVLFFSSEELGKRR